MFPGGMNPKQMQKMLKRMGIKVDEIEAQRVVIEGVDKDIIIENPQVMLTKMPNQEMFQISGDVTEVDKDEAAEAEPEITDEDIAMVSEQAGVGKQRAEEALLETRGDIAEAILKLKESDLESDAAD